MKERIRLYSAKKRDAEKGGKKDTYKYDSIPDVVIGQIEVLLDHVIGNNLYVTYVSFVAYTNYNPLWKKVADFLMKENGDANGLNLFRASGDYNYKSYCLNYLHEVYGENENLIDSQLDFIEVVCNFASEKLPYDDGELDWWKPRDRFDAEYLIDEINYRFKKGAVGYEYQNGEIIRIDNKYIHREVVVNALSLINEGGFEGANKEFMEAHECYRGGKNDKAITDACKAFESVMKTICDELNIGKGDGVAGTLITKLNKAGLFPNYLGKSFDNLIPFMKSSLPVIRNEDGAHGQGKSIKDTPNHLAAYAMHLSATNIVFLIECFKQHRDKPKKST